MKKVSDTEMLASTPGNFNEKRPAINAMAANIDHSNGCGDDGSWNNETATTAAPTTHTAPT